MSGWRAIWPVLNTGLPLDDLMRKAKADLPAVAKRHRVELVGRQRWTVRPGQDVPGSAGAEWVVVCESCVVVVDRRTEVAS
jgi:hypothetical protein